MGSDFAYKYARMFTSSFAQACAEGELAFRSCVESCSLDWPWFSLALLFLAFGLGLFLLLRVNRELALYSSCGGR